MSAGEAPRQFAAFLGVGATAALANFGSRFAFGQVVEFELSVLMAFFVGLSTAFLLNRAFVFSGDRKTTWRTEALRFLLVNGAGLLVTLAAAIVAVRALEAAFGPSTWVEGLAHLIGLGCTAFTSFFAHKYWTFGG